MSGCHRQWFWVGALLLLVAVGCSQGSGTAADAAPPPPDAVAAQAVPGGAAPAVPADSGQAAAAPVAPAVPAVAADASGGGVPDIEFDELEHNFGSVAGQAKVAHNFVFRNKGTGTLIIQNVKGG